ncbi:unnamed protein product [Hymenolepis diminuta]|uniref:PUM-HD domain-containing protein n=1 Tax=Hymenolepis diminuta TaxID=6216 RepID=A0A564YEI8_HYMDI|nr:unnamed protein product [Hymenolepis diminuta]
MNEYSDPNAPGRPVVKSNDQSSPSKNPCTYDGEQNTSDANATKQSPLSFRGFVDDSENCLSWGVEGCSTSRFGGPMRFSHKSLWDPTDDSGGLSTAAVWGRGNPTDVDKDSVCDPFQTFSFGVPLLPMSPGNKDAGELSKQVTNFVLSDPNNQDASSPGMENKIPSNSQFRPQFLMAEGSSDSLYLSQQETPLIQNGEVNRVPRFGQIDNIQVSMNPFAPQGPSVSMEDLERLVAQLGGIRLRGGTREQQQILPPPPQSSQVDSYHSNGFFSVAQDPRPNFVYDQHQNSSAPLAATPDLSSSGCPNIFPQQGPSGAPGFPQQLEVSSNQQQQPDPYAFAAAAAAVMSGTAQPNCIPLLNQPPFAGQPGSLTMTHGTFDQGASQSQSGFYSPATAADRLKNLAILSNGGMNVLPIQQLRVPPVGSPFMEQLSQMVQMRPVQPNTFNIPPPQQGAPTRSQIIDQQLPLSSSSFCYPDGSHPQPSQYVACPSPLNPPPLLTPLPFPHPNPNTPAPGDCYPLPPVTPDALSNPFSMGFTRFGQQPQRNRVNCRFNRPPLGMDAYGARPPTHIRGGQSFTPSHHQQQKPVYYRNQPPPPVNFTSNGCGLGPRMPLVSNPTPIPSQVLPPQPMMPLQSHSSLSASSHQMMMSDRNRPLDDYNKYTRIEQMSLQNMSGCFVKYSKDQTGSRLIQLKLEKASVADKNVVFNEILPSCHELITDVFGNYVIQKFLDLGTPEQKLTLMKEMEGKVRELSLHVYGCRVIQKAIETFDETIQLNIMKQLKDSVLECVKDQNGNHVVQKCIERVPPQHLQFIVDAYKGNVLALSTHSYGCRVIQRILQYCTPEQVDPIFEELYACANSLFEDQYGNYVIQHILEKGTREQKSRIIGLLKGRVVTLSMHKFASNVVEKAVSNGTTQERQELTSEVLVGNGQQQWNSTEPIENNDKTKAEGNSVLWSMMKDQYANYVIQKMLEEADSKLRQELMRCIQPYLNSLRQFNYAKHIISKMEKYTLRTFGNSSVDNVAVILANADLNSDVLTSDDDGEVEGAGTNHQELVKKGNSDAPEA